MTAVMESTQYQPLTVADKKNTKIVATVGPSCSEYNQLLELAKAGVNVFRLNFSHGEHATHLTGCVKINSRSAKSLGVKHGSDVFVSGKLTPFLFFKMPP